MKYLRIFILFIIFMLNLSSATFAQSKTTPTSPVTQQQIDELKSKIASKVAELKLVEKRGVIGKVTDTSDTEITLNDISGNIKNIDVDELTKFYSSANSFGISDIKKGQTLGVLGLYNKDSRRILAREVNDIPTPQTIVIGVISNIDKVNYELTLTKASGNKAVFEIQDATKTSIYSGGELTKFGFSKIQTDQTAVATGTMDKQSPGKYLSIRVIILPDINLAAKLKPQNVPSPIPATGSGLKFYPPSQ